MLTCFLVECQACASRGASGHFYDVNVILIVAAFVFLLPYFISLALRRISGIYMSDWDNNLGSCFGGSLGGGYGMFSGKAKKSIGGKW